MFSKKKIIEINERMNELEKKLSEENARNNRNELYINDIKKASISMENALEQLESKLCDAIQEFDNKFKELTRKNETKTKKVSTNGKKQETP